MLARILDNNMDNYHEEEPSFPRNDLVIHSDLLMLMGNSMTYETSQLKFKPKGFKTVVYPYAL